MAYPQCIASSFVSHTRFPERSSRPSITRIEIKIEIEIEIGEKWRWRGAPRRRRCRWGGARRIASSIGQEKAALLLRQSRQGKHIPALLLPPLGFWLRSADATRSIALLTLLIRARFGTDAIRWLQWIMFARFYVFVSDQSFWDSGSTMWRFILLFFSMFLCTVTDFVISFSLM